MGRDEGWFRDARGGEERRESVTVYWDSDACCSARDTNTRCNQHAILIIKSYLYVILTLTIAIPNFIIGIIIFMRGRSENVAYYVKWFNDKHVGIHYTPTLDR